MLDKRFKTDNESTDLPDDFFEIQLERDEYKSLTEDCIKAIIRKIMAVSNLMFHSTRRGGPDQIIFNGPLGTFIHNELQYNMPHFRNVKLLVNERSGDGVDNIELVRTGDFFKIVYENAPPDDITMSSAIKLERTKRKQPDTVYKIKIKE